MLIIHSTHQWMLLHALISGERWVNVVSSAEPPSIKTYLYEYIIYFTKSIDYKSIGRWNFFEHFLNLNEQMLCVKWNWLPLLKMFCCPIQHSFHTGATKEKMADNDPATIDELENWIHFLYSALHVRSNSSCAPTTSTKLVDITYTGVRGNFGAGRNKN